MTGRLVVAHGRVLDARRLPVVREGRDLGVVVVLSDRTDLDDLGRELEATRALTDALRAQAHEHANQLHALSGMLHLGHEQAALAYITELAGGVSCSGQVEEPYLAGLLGAKTAAASERGVELRVAEETRVAGRLERPLDCVTVVGNLLDNATRAAATGRRCPAWACSMRSRKPTSCRAPIPTTATATASPVVRTSSGIPPPAKCAWAVSAGRRTRRA